MRTAGSGAQRSTEACASPVGIDVMLEQQNEDGSVELLERCRREWEICKNNKKPLV